MKLKKYLIAGGNSTLLVWDCPLLRKNEIIKTYLGEVEQIGFISKTSGISKLNMMGDELCINGAIALASTLNEKGSLLASGYEGIVKYRNVKNRTEIQLTIPYKKIGRMVLLSGIGYIFKKAKENISGKFLSDLAIKYNLPAFGALKYLNKKLIPYVYVRQTNSLFEETACGSGSIALNILLGLETIIQTTGEKISVKKSGNTFTVRAKVVRIE